MMRWGKAFVWGTLFVAVLLGLLIAGYYFDSLLHGGHPSRVAAAGEHNYAPMIPPIAAAVKPLGVVAAAESGAIARPPVRFPVGGYFGEPERALAAAPRVGAGPCVPLT
jgi:hypothetical protein